MMEIIRDTRERLIKIHSIATMIRQTVETVDSAYIYPAKAMAEAQATFHINLRQSLSHIKRARKMYLDESKVASRYNIIAQAVASSCDGGISALDKRYHECIKIGKYEEADKLLDSIISQVSLNKVDEWPCQISIGSDQGFITLTNSSGNKVLIQSVIACKGNTVAYTSSEEFELESGNTRRFTFNNTTAGPITVKIRYYQNGIMTKESKEIVVI